jgi:hypothetical protein
MSASAVSESAQEDRSFGSGLYIALVPWVAFTLLAQHSTLKLASVAALVLAIAIMIRSIVTTGVMLLEVGAVVAFTGFTVVAFGADHSAGIWMGFHGDDSLPHRRRSNRQTAHQHPLQLGNRLLLWGIKQSGKIADEATAGVTAAAAQAA